MANEDKIPVIEIFGPVLQGEGQLIGRPTWFLRTGACDYACFHCDSMHAVDPKQIEQNKTVMSSDEILDRIIPALGNCSMVTLSGGNPALWPLDKVVLGLRDNGTDVAIETQGTVYKEWIAQCDYVTVSPKGPGMVGPDVAIQNMLDVGSFLNKLGCDGKDLSRGVCIKVPVFDSDDLNFANDLYLRLFNAGMGFIPWYFSVGNHMEPRPGYSAVGVEIMRQELLRKLDWLFRAVQESYPRIAHIPMLPQLHVLQYGNEKGK